MNPTLASVIGFVISFVISFYLNSKWTFSAKRDVHTLFKYLTVTLSGFFLNISIIYLFNSILNIWYIYAQAIVIVVVPVHNFILSKFWAFK